MRPIFVFLNLIISSRSFIIYVVASPARSIIASYNLSIAKRSFAKTYHVWYPLWMTILRIILGKNRIFFIFMHWESISDTRLNIIARKDAISFKFSARILPWLNFGRFTFSSKKRYGQGNWLLVDNHSFFFLNRLRVHVKYTKRFLIFIFKKAMKIFYDRNRF